MSLPDGNVENVSDWLPRRMRGLQALQPCSCPGVRCEAALPFLCLESGSACSGWDMLTDATLQKQRGAFCFTRPSLKSDSEVETSSTSLITVDSENNPDASGQNASRTGVGFELRRLPALIRA